MYYLNMTNRCRVPHIWNPVVIQWKTGHKMSTYTSVINETSKKYTNILKLNACMFNKSILKNGKRETN